MQAPIVRQTVAIHRQRREGDNLTQGVGAMSQDEPVSLGAKLEPEILKRLAQHRCACGELPKVPALEVTGGPSSGETCQLCKTPVRADDTLIEVTAGPAHTIPFHVECFHAWEQVLIN